MSDEAVYKKRAGLYAYAFQPDFADSGKEYQQEQLTAIEAALRSQRAAILELQAGTSTGTTVRLANTGVTAGRYRNAIVTVGPDGRVVDISSGPTPPEPLPVPASAGLVLTSTTRGAPVWSDPGRRLPDGGEEGQVLSIATGAPAWTTPPAAERSLLGLSLRPGQGISGNVSILSRQAIVEIGLTPTGVQPGTYTSAEITIDASGRITAASNGASDDDDGDDGGGSFDPNTPIDWFTMTDQGTTEKVFLSIENAAWVFTADGVLDESGFPIQAEDGSGSIAAEG